VITGGYKDKGNTTHGFLRSPNGDITTIDASGSVATSPESINEAGAITGYFMDKDFIFHGFLLSP